MKKILMNDFKSEPNELVEEMSSAVFKVIKSGWYVLGNEGNSFENKWAKACGVNFGIGVGNGMDAIEIIIRSLGITKGDEVITTPMTAFASVLAIIRAGATPVLADIDPSTALMSPESVQRCISKKTRAVLLVHLYGQVRQMETWIELCDEHKILLIEDCAQAHLASYKGTMAGSFGIASAFSFYPTKNLGALGDAGIILCNDAELAVLCSKYRNYGQSSRYFHPILGMNSRMDEIQAAILEVRLKWLDFFNSRRRCIGAAFDNGISNPNIHKLSVPEEPLAHVYHLYCLLCSDRDKLILHLQKNEIQTLIHYPVPVHLQEPLFNIRRDPKGLSASEWHSRNCLSIPCHPQLHDDDVARIIEAVNCF